MGEIDLIARQGSELVFIEVKTRRSDFFGRPEEAVNPAKLARLFRLAEYYQDLHPELPPKLRIDVVAVIFSSAGQPQIEVFRGVF